MPAPVRSEVDDWNAVVGNGVYRLVTAGITIPDYAVLGRNMSGGRLYAGELVVWATSSVSIVASATGAANMTIADDLSDNVGAYTLVAELGAASTGSIRVTGYDYEGDPATTTTTVTNDAKVRISGTWARISNVSVLPDATGTTVVVTGYCVGAVARASVEDATACTLAGVILWGDSGANDGIIDDGELCVVAGGPVVAMYVYGETAGIGSLLGATGEGHVKVVDGTNPDGVVGICLEPACGDGERLFVQDK